jgi:hypothetical protein
VGNTGVVNPEYALFVSLFFQLGKYKFDTSGFVFGEGEILYCVTITLK